MPADSQPQFDSAAICRLACPACHSNLHFNSERLTCAACGRTYPIIDGIPVLTMEQVEASGSTTRGN
jgi:uncharacterized protein YbaR (Trm112 family)